MYIYYAKTVTVIFNLTTMKLRPCQSKQLLSELFERLQYMLCKLTECCRTSLAAVSGSKTAAARDAELLLSNMAPPIRVKGYYFACGTFLYV